MSTRIRPVVLLLAVAAAVLVLPAVLAGAAQRTVLPDCLGRPRFKPAAYVIACADANYFIDHLHWSSWTARTAAATGQAHFNTCKPDCVHGRIRTSAATVTLSKPHSCGRARRPSFSRLTVHARGVSRRPIPISCGPTFG